MNLDTHCPNCFANKHECRCQFDSNLIIANTNFLPPFTALNQKRYYTGRVLGFGGFGVVYAGYDTSLESTIAIKEFFPIKNQLATRNYNGLTVDPHLPRLETFIYWHQQFLEEAKLLHQLNHSSIVRLSNILKNENATTYLIMERLNGATLTEYLGGLQQAGNRIFFTKRLSETEVETLFTAAISALNFLHDPERQIIHLDINPNNIFLVNAKLSQLKLLDFGLARVNFKFQNSANDVIVGDPAFMAPEQIQLHANKPITTATDCYSLGACMYVALTGQIPIITARLAGTPLADLKSQLPNLHNDALIETITVCLNLNPAQRPQNAMELNECLKNKDLRNKYLDNKLKITTPIEYGHTILLELPLKNNSESIPLIPTNLEPSNPVQSKRLIVKSVYSSVLFLIIIIGIVLIYCNLFSSTPKTQSRYKINNDGTVLDTAKSLLWKRCSEGQTWNGKTCNGKATAMNWNEIMPNGQPKTWNNFAGQDNWRIPTIEELHALVLCNNSNSCNDDIIDYDINNTQPTIDQNLFPNTPNSWFWSISTADSDTKNIQVVYFVTGNKYWTNSLNNGYARLVRFDNAHSYAWNEMLLYCINLLFMNKHAKF